MVSPVSAMTTRSTPGGATLATMAAVAVVGASAFAIAPLLPDIAGEFDVGVAQAGLLIAAYSASVAVTAPLCGLSAQRLPRATVIVAGLVLFAASWLAVLLVTRFEGMLAVAALAGIASGAVLPAAYAYAGDLSSFANRGRVMGYIVSGWSIAILVVAPAMAAGAQVMNWRYVFAGLALAALGAAAGLALARKPAAPRPSPSERPFWHDVFANLRTVLTHRATLVVLTANFLDMGAFYGIFSYLGSEIRVRLEVGSSVTGVIMASYGVGLAIVTLNGRIFDRIGIWRTAVVSLALLSGLLLAIPHLVVHVAVITLAVAAWGILQGSFFTTITALATEQIPHLRGVVTAILSCTTYLGMTAFTLLASAVYGDLGYGALGVLSAAAAAAGSLLLATGRPRRA